MTQEEFESLVRRLETRAAADPVGYRRRLAALALLGYGYMGGVVALLLGGTAVLAWLAASNPATLLLLKKIGWAILVLVYLVARALWIKLEPPRGQPLTPAKCPRLFERIEALRARTRAPALAGVLLTNELNASVVQMPRFGMLGGTRNYLLLGLPLMQALSAAELESVIAHELGHLSGAHGRFGAWIYRLRAGWTRLLEALHQEQHWGTALFKRFFDWYAPLFNAYSFVQARRQEYEADRMSVEAVGARTAASALLRVNVQGDFISEKFWPAVFRRAETDPVPGFSPFAMLALALRQPAPASTARNWLSRSLARRTGYDDTHPCLADRLAALGVAPFIPEPLTVNAAEALLGEAAASFQEQMDEQWRSEIRHWWGERHRYLNDARARLAALERKSMISSLTEEELWERAQLTAELSSDEAAESFYRAVLERNPQHAGALFRYGQILLDRDDENGVRYLNAAQERDSRAAQAVCALLAGFFRRHGRESEARTYESRWWTLHEAAQRIERDRNQVRTDDRFIGHGLSPAQARELARQLQEIGGIRRAFLVRKQLQAPDQEDLFVLGVLPDVPWWKPTSRRGERELIARISAEVQFPAETLIISLGSNRDFRKPLAAVPGSTLLP